MNFWEKGKKMMGILARIQKNIYLCIAIDKRTDSGSTGKREEGSLGEWLKPPVC